MPIAHWLIEILKPNCVVELGTHYGVSFFSFCEAAELYSEKTFVYAIDCWEGDSQAGFYDNEVYQTVSEHQNNYHRRNSRLIRSRFDEAAEHFSENSIDILHIDGLHTYEAVKNDYFTWKKKLKRNGTILFHDWNVREGDFGVWRLWEEIKEEKDAHIIEIKNGHGLGIVTYGMERPIWHGELVRDLPALKIKGALLSENNRKEEQIKSKTNEIKILRAQLEETQKHAMNQEEIIAYLKKSRLRRAITKIRCKIKRLGRGC